MVTSSASKKSDPEAIDRPVEPSVWADAKRIAAEYKILIEFDDEDGRWYGSGLELPGARGDGKTPNQCVECTREAMTGMVAYMLEEGEEPPRPADDNRRTEQVNVRLTPHEKLRLETATQAGGYKGLSDFMRSASLEKSR